MPLPISPAEAAKKLIERRNARAKLLDYILYTTPGFKNSAFADKVCATLDQFILDVNVGKRPILILEAPPQHGKTEIVSRKLPPFLLGNYPDIRIAGASYSNTWASSINRDVRANLAGEKHLKLFPVSGPKRKYTVNRNGEFSNPHGPGSMVSDGVGGGFTGRAVDVFIIDDPIKNHEEALSEITKESIWNWYQSTSKTRMSERSGTIIMATRWAEDDLSGRIIKQMDGDIRLTVLSFPAINLPTEAGYRRDLPQGALCPELHSMDQLLEFKREMSDYWWAALYQQTPKALGGNVFKEKGVRFYLPKDLPKKFSKIVDSWDCTFKDTDGTDYVVGQKWGLAGANAYLLYQIRGRMGFTETAERVKQLRNMNGYIAREILIEDKANGPAVIDFLKKEVFGLIAIEPDGSKKARAHAVTSVWEAGNVWLPHPDTASWVGSVRVGDSKPDTFLSEITHFDAGAHDDQVDSMTQALRRLFPLFGRLSISSAVVDASRR